MSDEIVVCRNTGINGRNDVRSLVKERLIRKKQKYYRPMRRNKCAKIS